MGSIRPYKNMVVYAGEVIWNMVRARNLIRARDRVGIVRRMIHYSVRD